MTTMVTELYDALRDAGASDDKARRAAEALANYDDRFNRLERQIDGLDRRIDGVDQKIDRVALQLGSRIDAVGAELSLLRWMRGTSLALSVAILVQLFVH